MAPYCEFSLISTEFLILGRWALTEVNVEGIHVQAKIVSIIGITVEAVVDFKISTSGKRECQSVITNM